MSQPFDNRDYDVQLLGEKDAKIEKLKGILRDLTDSIDGYLSADGSRGTYDSMVASIYRIGLLGKVPEYRDLLEKI